MGSDDEFFQIEMPLKVPETENELKLRVEFISYALPEYTEKLEKCLKLYKKNQSKAVALKFFESIKLTSADLLILWTSYDLNYASKSELEPRLSHLEANGRLNNLKGLLIGYEKPKLRAKMAVLECLAYLIGPTAILKLIEISDLYLGDLQFAELLLAMRKAKTSGDEDRVLKSKKMSSAISSSLAVDKRKGKKAYKKFNEARFLYFIFKEALPLLKQNVISIEGFKRGCSNLEINLEGGIIEKLEDINGNSGNLALELLIRGNYISSESAYWDQTKIYGGLSTTQWVELFLAPHIHENFFLNPVLRSPKVWKSLSIVTPYRYLWSGSRKVPSIATDAVISFFGGDEATARKFNDRGSRTTRPLF